MKPCGLKTWSVSEDTGAPGGSGPSALLCSFISSFCGPHTAHLCSCFKTWWAHLPSCSKPPWVFLIWLNSDQLYNWSFCTRYALLHNLGAPQSTLIYLTGFWPLPSEFSCWLTNASWPCPPPQPQSQPQPLLLWLWPSHLSSQRRQCPARGHLHCLCSGHAYRRFQTPSALLNLSTVMVDCYLCYLSACLCACLSAP